jgi:hypothetical protein
MPIPSNATLHQDLGPSPGAATINLAATFAHLIDPAIAASIASRVVLAVLSAQPLDPFFDRTEAMLTEMTRLAEPMSRLTPPRALRPAVEEYDISSDLIVLHALRSLPWKAAVATILRYERGYDVRGIASITYASKWSVRCAFAEAERLEREQPDPDRTIARVLHRNSELTRPEIRRALAGSPTFREEAGHPSSSRHPSRPRSSRRPSPRPTSSLPTTSQRSR